jgi:Xaa-Pro aminopeptidase
MTIDASAFAGRRERFSDLLRGEIAVIPAANEAVRNHDVHHEFRQDSDFWYLTGFGEPDAVVVIDPSHPEERFVLFVRPRDREREIWDGYRAGVEGAREIYGADAAHPIEELADQLARRMVGRTAVYTPLARTAFAGRVTGLVNRVRGLADRFGRAAPVEVRDAAPLLHELRLRKTDDEVAALRRACALTAAGHAEAMRFATPGLYEYQVEAAMEYVWRAGGSPRNGYESIVASGPNACVLHYTTNDRRMEAGDLLLIDAAAEVEYFSSDITRTFPVDGRFRPEQRAVYDVVLAAQHAALAPAAPGGTMKAIDRAAVEEIAAGLVSLGLLPGPLDRVMATHQYREFFMHGTGHWLGHDVHDAGAYGVDGAPRPLEPGMAFTVEPGIYVDPHREVARLSLLEYDLDEWTERRILLGTKAARKLEEAERAEAGTIDHPVPEALRGVGVRIEDDVLITASGHENLTAAVPTDPDAVEAMCAEAPTLPRPT